MIQINQWERVILSREQNQIYSDKLVTLITEKKLMHFMPECSRKINWTKNIEDSEWWNDNKWFVLWDWEWLKCGGFWWLQENRSRILVQFFEPLIWGVLSKRKLMKLINESNDFRTFFLKDSIRLQNPWNKKISSYFMTIFHPLFFPL